MTYEDLASFLSTGLWHKDKPGLLITFDDGLRTHAEVAAPLLEEFGFTGWFFLPYAFLDTPEPLQRKFALEHRIRLAEDLPGPLVAMNWDQARHLLANHVVGCHTASHCRLNASLTAEQLECEIPIAKQILEERLQREVDSFAWVGGEQLSYSRAAAQCIADAGFRFSFMTNCAMLGPQSHPLQLDRIQIESDYSMEEVRLRLSGLMDVWYTRKRRWVHKETAIESPGVGARPDSDAMHC